MSNMFESIADKDGKFENDKLPQAIQIVTEANEKMQRGIQLELVDILQVLEQYVVSTHNFLISQIADLSNEVTSMWNFVGKMAGGKGHKNQNTEKDLEEMILSLQFTRLMAMHNLLVSKGGNESGLLLPGE